MRVDLLDFVFPTDLIAQTPLEARDGARLLVVDTPSIEHLEMSTGLVAELHEKIPENALLVVNDTRVIPARLIGKKTDTGGKVEIFLVRAEHEEEHIEGGGYKQVWRCMGKASKALRFGQALEIGDELQATILGRGEDGLLRVEFQSASAIRRAIDAYGHVPLPPYIKREDVDEDTSRYQTIFARHDGAVAAPTAGLHLSPALLGRCTLRGIELASITLHVGLGTFQPVLTSDLNEHAMHAETIEIDQAAAKSINQAKKEKRPIFAVGTTVVRALESAALKHKETCANDGNVIHPMVDETRLLIQPGFECAVVDGLLTNFHMPRTTLLALVSAFIGVKHLHQAYHYAIQERFRLFSYGDAMLIRRHLTAEDARLSVQQFEAFFSANQGTVPLPYDHSL